MSSTVLETDCVKCELDESVPVLRHRWLRKPSGEEFREGLQTILKEYVSLSKVTPGLKWLADTELLGELAPEDEKWLVDVWDDLLFKDAGVKVHAVVLGDDIFADYPMEDFKMSSARKFNEMGVKLEVFTSVEDAYTWLKEN